MAPRTTMRQSLPPAAVVLILLACVIVGLGTGLGVRSVANGQMFASAPGHPATKTSKQATATATSVITPSPTTAPTALPTAATATGFSLVIVTAPPGSIAPGANFSVIVSVIAADEHTPVPGVLCTMAASQKGGTPLFQQWPASQVSNNLGKATWNLQAPNLAPGVYTLQVSAHGANGWYYYVVHSITIT